MIRVFRFLNLKTPFPLYSQDNRPPPGALLPDKTGERNPQTPSRQPLESTHRVHRDQRPVLYGLTCDQATPTSGSIVLDNNTSVGRITSGIPSPTLECGIGYVRFDAPGDWTGRMLQLRLLDGNVFPCEIVDLPFFDRGKNIVKGINRTIP